MKSAFFASFLPARIGRTGAHGAEPWLAGRLLVFATLAVVQIVVTSYFFNFPRTLGVEFDAVKLIKRFARIAPIAIALFLLVAWPRRRHLIKIWADALAAQNWALIVLVNGCAFLAVTFASIAFTRYAASAAEPPWGWFGLYCCLLALAGLSLALVAAPAMFWRRIISAAPVETALTLFGAGVVLVADELSWHSWDTLASATLLVAAALLSLYEPEVVVDMSRKLLGVGDFQALVYAECSGYEGIGIVTVIMTLYLWIFRAELRFPHALLLLPIGIVGIWLLNAARIAALVSIGGHLSPAVALDLNFIGMRRLWQS